MLNVAHIKRIITTIEERQHCFLHWSTRGHKVQAKTHYKTIIMSQNLQCQDSTTPCSNNRATISPIATRIVREWRNRRINVSSECRMRKFNPIDYTAVFYPKSLHYQKKVTQHSRKFYFCILLQHTKILVVILLNHARGNPTK